MSIEYSEPIRKPLVDKDTNELHQWVFGLEGTCSETGTCGFVDVVWDCSDKPKKHFSHWTKEEIDAEYIRCEFEEDFVGKIRAKIDAKNAKKVVASDFNYNDAPNT